MWVKVIIFHSLLVGFTLSDNPSKCDITELSSDDWDWPIVKTIYDNVNVKSNLLISSYNGNVDNLEPKCRICGSDCPREYLDFSKNDTHFLISIAQGMKNIDEDMITNNCVGTVVYSCHMTCQSETQSTLNVELQINDYNDYPPEISYGETTYTVPSPLMPKGDIIIYGDKISATDKDFNNTEINFKISPDDFDVVTTEDSSTKPATFHATFRAKRVIQIPENGLKYTLTATDNGVYPGPKTSEPLEISLEMDKDTSLDIPSFVYPAGSSSYTFQYKDDKLTVLKGPISVNTAKPTDAARSLQLSGDLSKHFAVQYDTVTSEVQLIVKTKIDDPTSSYTILTLGLKTDNTATTPIVIYFSDAPVDTGPKFTQHVYTGKYDDSKNLVDLEQIIKVTSTSTNELKVTVSGDLMEKFEVTPDTDKNTYKVIVKEPLTSAEIKSKKYLYLTLEASVDSESDTSGLIITLPIHNLEFTNVLYAANYTEDDTVSVDETQPIGFKNDDVSEVSISVEDKYSNYFNVIYQNKKYLLTVKEALPKDILKSETEIPILITAKDKYDNEANAVIKIALPRTEKSDAPKFNDPFYIVQYKKDQTGNIDFEPALTFTNYKDISKISILLTTYSENFEVIQESNKWRLHIKKALDADTYARTNEIVTAMEATETGIAEKGVAVLVIELTDDPISDNTPEFNEPFYIVHYNKKQTGYFDFNPAVSFKNVKDTSTISIDLSGSPNNIQVVYNSDRWRLKISTPLSDEDFSDGSELITTMEATVPDVIGTGSTVLVISLVDSETETPKFKEVYYTADYPKSGKGSFVFDDDLAFERLDDFGKVTITVGDEYSSNFKIEYSTSKKLWQITIQQPLAQNLLDSNSYITTKLTAKIDGSAFSPETAFVLSLPKEEEEEAPVFTKSYYKADYAISGATAVVTFEDDIGFTNKDDMTKIKITSDEFPSYFTFKFEISDKKWRLISDGILDANLLNRTDLIVAVTASDETNKLEGHSVIDIKLPSVNTDGAPKFSKTYYTGRYEIVGNTSTVTLDEDIGFLNKNDATTIQIITDKYKDNFNFLYADGKWSVAVSKNLDQSVLNSKIDIVMALIATENSKTDEIGQSALLLTLPTINDDGAPQFDQIVYEADCHSKTTILDKEIKIKDKTDLSKITVSFLEDEYKSNFDIAFNITMNYWFVTVNSIPSLTEGKSDLVLTLIATENGKIGQAALVINFPVLSTPKFSKDQYYGNYTLLGDDDPQFEVEDFSIVNKDNQNDISLIINGDFSENFNVTYDKKNNLWKMTLINAIDETKVINKTTVILTLTATEEENDNLGKSTLIIYLTNNNEGNEINFTQVHYTGSYESNVDTTMVKLDKNIQITSSKDVSTAVVKIKNSDDFDASSYFALTKNSDYYEVAVLQPLTQEILQKQKSLVMTLEANLDNDTKYATLVVELPLQVAAKSVKFEKPLYNGEYEIAVDGKVTFTVDTAIIVSDEDVANIKVVISEDSIYGKYFDLKTTEKSVKLLPKAALPKDVYTKETVIPIIMVAGITGSTTKASTVVDININYNSYLGFVQFDNLLYNGKYEITKKVVTVKVDTIKLSTDKPDQIEVFVGNVYKKYFEAKYTSTSSEVTITKILDIPDSILDETSTVSILLTASIKNTEITSNSIVNLRIINDDTPHPDETGTIAFNTVSNTGEYSVENNKGNLKIDNTIGITTDRTTEEIDTSITDDLGLSTYFNSSYNGQVFAVTLFKDLPENVFLSNSFISLTLTAKIKGTSQTASAVLTIKFDNNQDVDTGHINFQSIVYNGVYQIDDNVATIVDNDNIVVDTDADDTNVALTILNGMDKFFKASYFNKIVTLSVTSSAASSMLRSQSNIAVVLLAEIRHTLISTETVINLKVKDNDNDPNPDNSTLGFPKLIYNAEYVHEYMTFTVDDQITLVTDRTENEIDVTIENDLGYQKYFGALYRHNQVVITLKQNLPESLFDEDYNNLALTVKASVKNTNTIYAQAVLNIKLIDKNKSGLKGNDDDNDTPYIIAISFLSVFILLLIVAAILFYYFKLRKTSRYEKMSEDEYIKNSKVKFDKTATSRKSGDTMKRSSAIEQRRPTGFIFKHNPTTDENNDPRESHTDSENANKERRKSVAFDDNVEKLQIDQANDDDVEKATTNVE